MKKRKTIIMGKIMGIGIIGILLCSGMVSVSACSTDLYAGSDLTIVGEVIVRRSSNLLYVTYICHVFNGF